jgi:hypothetical protein
VPPFALGILYGCCPWRSVCMWNSSCENKLRPAPFKSQLVVHQQRVYPLIPRKGLPDKHQSQLALDRSDAQASFPLTLISLQRRRSA